MRGCAKLIDAGADSSQHAIDALTEVFDRALDLHASFFVFSVDYKLLLGKMALGDVVDRGEPAAVGEWLAHVLHDAAVVELCERSIGRLPIEFCEQLGGKCPRIWTTVRASSYAQFENSLHCRARLRRLSRQGIYLGVARITQDETLIAVKYAHALRHIAEHEIEHRFSRKRSPHGARKPLDEIVKHSSSPASV